VWSLSAPYLIILSELEKKNTNLKGGGMKTEKLKRVNIIGVYILFSVLHHRIVSYIIFVLSSFYLVK